MSLCDCPGCSAEALPESAGCAEHLCRSGGIECFLCHTVGSHFYGSTYSATTDARIAARENERWVNVDMRPRIDGSADICLDCVEAIERKRARDAEYKSATEAEKRARDAYRKAAADEVAAVTRCYEISKRATDAMREGRLDDAAAAWREYDKAKIEADAAQKRAKACDKAAEKAWKRVTACSG